MMIASVAACLLVSVAQVPNSTERRIIVVNAETGKPIPGAEVLAVQEVNAPTWSDVWWRHRGMTDEAGEVLLPRSTDDNHYGWLFARAKGFGARAAGDAVAFSTTGPGDFRFELMPETPLLIELLDFTGAPLSLAHLGVALGCGHTPDLLSTTTGPDGRAVLRGYYDYDGGINDLFIVHPEVGRSTYSHVPVDDAVDGVVRVYAPSEGRLLHGQVLLPDLTPAVGYAVGTKSNHRGPWAVTNAEGEFQLYGWDPDQSSFDVHDPTGKRVAGFNGARVGVERLLVLDGTTDPERYVDGEEGNKEPRAAIQVEVTVTGEGWANLREGDRSIAVQAWNPDTGMSFSREARVIINADQTTRSAMLFLPSGNYMVEVGCADTPYAPVGLGRIRAKAYIPKGLGDPKFIWSVVKAEVPVPRLVTLDVPQLGADFTFSVAKRSHSESFKPGEDGVTLQGNGRLQVERFAVPYGRLGFCLERVVDGVSERIDLELEPGARATDRWSLRPRRR